MTHHLTTCTFCGAGCGIYLETAGNEITGTYPSMSHPANGGRICVRGWHVHEVASSPDRLKTPLLRTGDGFREASWEEAYTFIADRLRSIRDRHGPDAIGFLNSPRCSNEEAYLLQKFARAVVGTNNVDHGTGVHRATTIEVLLDMLGVPAATCAYEDIDRAGVIVVDGIDLARQIPTIGGRVIRAKLAGATLIVTGPRRHRIAEHADVFLQNRAGTDVALYGAMAKVIVNRGLVDLAFVKARCRDYEAFLQKIQSYDVLWAASLCGVEPGMIEEAAIRFARAPSAMLLYSTGAEARGADGVRAVVNLALLTGNLGKPGAGVLPLAEHNNLQGGCDVGMLPHLLPGYRSVSDPAARRSFEGLWGAPVPERPGLDARTMLAEGGERLRALWLCRHDPVVTATYCDAAETLKRLDLLVVQHLFMTETARHAHVVLPVVAFGEEEITFTNAERRIQLTARAVEPPPGPRPAWRQIAEVAALLGAPWRYETAAEVMAEIGQAVPAYERASYRNLAREYGRQWPCTNDRPLGTPRLFADGGGGPFRLAAIPRPAAVATTSTEYPFGLIFGFSLYYWHRNVLVQHSETLKREYKILLLDYPDGFVDLNGEDARDLGVRDGGRIRLVAETGSAVVTARVTDEVKRGMVFLPYFLREVEERLLGASTDGFGRGHAPVSCRVERV